MHKINEESTSDNVDIHFTHFLRKTVTCTFLYQLVTEKEIVVYQVIKYLNAENNRGSDGISSKLIKEMTLLHNNIILLMNYQCY